MNAFAKFPFWMLLQAKYIAAYLMTLSLTYNKCRRTVGWIKKHKDYVRKESWTNLGYKPGICLEGPRKWSKNLITIYVYADIRNEHPQNKSQESFRLSHFSVISSQFNPQHISSITFSKVYLKVACHKCRKMVIFISSTTKTLASLAGTI